MTRILLTALLAGVLLAPVAPGAAPAVAQDDTQKLVFLGDGGPILVQMHLRLDGRSFRAVWRDFIDRLFDYLDVNRDGVLSPAEAAAAPPAAVLANRNGFFGGGQLIGGRRPGKMSRDDLAEHYRKTGLPPFQISYTERNDGIIRLNAFSGGLMGSGRTSADALNARLFKLLDSDGDGKLSRRELAAAPAVLGKLDENEDEVLTPDELTGQTRPRGNDDGFAFAFSPDTAIPTGEKPFHLVGDGKSDPALAKRLLARYAKKGEKKIEAKRLGLGKAALARLDRDGDGWLDEAELGRLGEAPADVILTVRLGKRGPQEPIVEVHKKGRKGTKVEPTRDGVRLTAGNTRLELRGPAKESMAMVNFDVKGQYLTQFKAADTDNNGYLDKKEAEKSGFFRGLFAVMDRDGDGKLFEKEVVAYLDQMAALRKRANGSCLSVVLRDQGKGLFELADTDGDGRLSVRELRNMVKLIERLDTDGDGCVALAEVPRSYRGTFEPGAVGSSGPTSGKVVVFLAGGTPPGPALPTRTRGPLWFRKMDRNRDGDVSRGEWLGTEEEFRKIDSDGDGLISAAEAEAYDRLKRGK